jgi:hypothetical protein
MQMFVVVMVFVLEHHRVQTLLFVDATLDTSNSMDRVIRQRVEVTK